MKNEEFENIINEQKNLKSLPNNKLVEFMDLLSSDFESTKQTIINTTLYLDKLENLPKRTVIIDAQFIDGVGNHYELCDLVKTKEEVLNSVEKISND